MYAFMKSISQDIEKKCVSFSMSELLERTRWNNKCMHD
jgi:hypothetical protein